MIQRLRSILREFLDDPLSAASDRAIQIVMLAVGVAVVIGAVRYAMSIIQ